MGRMTPADASEATGLEWGSDQEPGIARRRSGRGFRYVMPDGSPAPGCNLRRIRAMVIPPAWTDVWVSPRPDTHIQATGRDARNRKQYIYHPLWRAAQESDKFARMLDFGRALPRIREKVDRDLRAPEITLERVVAAAIRVLDQAPIRIGNDEYAEQNGTFGLTTLRSKHARVEGSRVMLEFVGKGRKPHCLDIRDPRVARVIRRCEDLPGQSLFQYLSPSGEVRRLRSDDVNAYLQAASGGGFTAKDFRTWAASVIAARHLADAGPPGPARSARSAVSAAVRATAAVLGNTVSVCRKCYIHPLVLEAYEQGSLSRAWARNGSRWGNSSRDASESLVLYLLRKG